MFDDWCACDVHFELEKGWATHASNPVRSAPHSADSKAFMLMLFDASCHNEASDSYHMMNAHFDGGLGKDYSHRKSVKQIKSFFSTEASNRKKKSLKKFSPSGKPHRSVLQSALHSEWKKMHQKVQQRKSAAQKAVRQTLKALKLKWRTIMKARKKQKAREVRANEKQKEKEMKAIEKQKMKDANQHKGTGAGAATSANATAEAEVAQAAQVAEAAPRPAKRPKSKPTKQKEPGKRSQKQQPAAKAVAKQRKAGGKKRPAALGLSQSSKRSKTSANQIPQMSERTSSRGRKIRPRAPGS